MHDEPEREGVSGVRSDESAGGSEEAKPGAAVLVMAEATHDAADLLRQAVSASGTLPVEETGELLTWLFDIFDQLLVMLGDVGRGLTDTHRATVAEGAVWDEANGGQAWERLHALDQAMVNLSSCRDVLGGAHMLLSHAQTDLDRFETMDGTATPPAGEEARFSL
ncbi:hypothetical protein [Actinomadura rupiterrae]|uniref:hypothetical protein n=1 Tax=Actinomadura rupiterrae TaxID=559627 RepID=UPI0020A50130|nr:hypothetical protein [Actinomadura rupiterrae]MCP2337239.1 hypothetical protein [Actinomadura rupiterrae]